MASRWMTTMTENMLIRATRITRTEANERLHQPMSKQRPARNPPPSLPRNRQSARTWDRSRSWGTLIRLCLSIRLIHSGRRTRIVRRTGSSLIISRSILLTISRSILLILSRSLGTQAHTCQGTLPHHTVANPRTHRTNLTLQQDRGVDRRQQDMERGGQGAVSNNRSRRRGNFRSTRLAMRSSVAKTMRCLSTKALGSALRQGSCAAGRSRYVRSRHS